MSKISASFKNWELPPLMDEWWEVISSRWSSAIEDRILLSTHYGLRVEGFGDTPDIRFDPMSPEAFVNYRLLEEVLTRLCKFPEQDMGRYIGMIGEPRPQVQWSLMSMYNMGFRDALDSIKKMESKNEKV